ncbi:MAG: hypothetical protein U0R51_08660 [Solirubrobacterales bacterium]
MRLLIAVGAVLGLALSVGGASGSAAPDQRPIAKKNPCANPSIRKARGLRCPDLKMARPTDLESDRRHGYPILRATSSIDSVGRGPAELHGRRTRPRNMVAVQRVAKKGGGKAEFRTKARLRFKRIPGQGRYWKWVDAARFELWTLDRDGRRKRRITTGEKQIYCLRDLVRTHPGLPHSPSSMVYPGCSQDGGARKVTLGTSVGWSDVYPASYYEQYVRLDDVNRKGCYALVHIADPKDDILELNEDNNRSSKVVYLKANGRYVPGRCKGVRDRRTAG